MKQKAFIDLLIKKMQERETKEGKRTTIQEFAKFLGVSQPLLSTWLKGNTEPSDKKINLLAEKLGEEVYETLGKIRPDPFIRYITKNWKKLPERKQKEIIETIKKYSDDPAPEFQRIETENELHKKQSNPE